MYGNLVQLLVTMKGLPLAYNKDLQEDKEGALDTAHTLMQCLSVMAGMISTWAVNEDAMARECGVGHLAATDVADYLAEGGTAPAAVAVQLDRAEAQLVADEGVFGSLTKVVEMGHGVKYGFG